LSPEAFLLLSYTVCRPISSSRRRLSER
jgi:hypothetical protein